MSESKLLNKLQNNSPVPVPDRKKQQLLITKFKKLSSIRKTTITLSTNPSHNFKVEPMIWCLKKIFEFLMYLLHLEHQLKHNNNQNSWHKSKYNYWEANSIQIHKKLTRFKISLFKIQWYNVRNQRYQLILYIHLLITLYLKT